MKAVVVDADWDPRAGAIVTSNEVRARRAVDAVRCGAILVGRSASVRSRGSWDPDHVIVRSRAVGICGSDVDMYEYDDDGYILLGYATSIVTPL